VLSSAIAHACELTICAPQSVSAQEWWSTEAELVIIVPLFAKFVFITLEESNLALPSLRLPCIIKAFEPINI
jgi:hypothetical protein